MTHLVISHNTLMRSRTVVWSTVNEVQYMSKSLSGIFFLGGRGLDDESYLKLWMENWNKRMQETPGIFCRTSTSLCLWGILGRGGMSHHAGWLWQQAHCHISSQWSTYYHDISFNLRMTGLRNYWLIVSLSIIQSITQSVYVTVVSSDVCHDEYDIFS